VETTWTPEPGPGFGAIFLDLLTKHQARANVVTDVHMPALAIEHGLAIYSADSDFARFTEIRWVNPIRA
jgi:predicted nucleic acid-binding protein